MKQKLLLIILVCCSLVYNTAKANESEPNNTRAQANPLALNGSNTGTIGTSTDVDWFKVTTNGDGRLDLTLTVSNSLYAWFVLYDNDGTTQLNQKYSNGNVTYSTDGLASGTYYIKIYAYHSGQMPAYTISDTLVKPAQANDAEPDSTRAQALTLPLNGSVTGHINYYYKNHRDSVDWYKVTTDKDGMLQLKISSANGQYIWAFLYDNNGTTQLNAKYSNSTLYFNTDGLAKGTYYIRITSYYQNGFAPYSLADSVFGYGTNDKEPNTYAKQGSTLLDRTANPAHVGFYYQNKRDTADWFKINYTGANNGSMSITLKLLSHKIDGSKNNTWIRIYKDTAGTALFTSYFIADSNVVNLSSLTQGYYYVKVFMYYGNQFQAYTLTPSYNQNKVAKITTTNYISDVSCADTNKISYQVSNTNPNSPSKVQLYRFGIVYDDPVIVPKGKIQVFDSLPAGVYYATAYADGATGKAYGTSDTITLEPVPASLTTTNITKSNATLNWAEEDCAKYFVINYKKLSASSWITRKTNGNINKFTLSGLAANTIYTWKVATADSANGQIAQSAFSDTANFITASLIANAGSDEENISANAIDNQGTITVSPNPATSFFIIHYNDNRQSKVNASAYDANGKEVWTSGLVNANTLNGKHVNASQFAKGVFYLKLTNENGELIGSTKIVVAN